MIDGLPWGSAGAQGLVQGSRYLHRRLGIVVQFPDGWSVRDSPSAVSANPLHGTETMITLEAVQPKRRSPEAVIERQLELEITGGREIDVDGMEGYFATVKSDGEEYRRRLVAVILKGDLAYVFKGDNRREDFESEFVRGFSETVASFRKMTAEDAEAARTERVEIVRADPDDTYEDLAAMSSLGRNAADRLRLLNGHYPRGQPRAGDRIKIID